MINLLSLPRVIKGRRPHFLVRKPQKNEVGNRPRAKITMLNPICSIPRGQVMNACERKMEQDMKNRL